MPHKEQDLALGFYCALAASTSRFFAAISSALRRFPVLPHAALARHLRRMCCFFLLLLLGLLWSLNAHLSH